MSVFPVAGVDLQQRPSSLFLLVHSDTTEEQTVNTGLPGLASSRPLVI